MSKRKPDEWNRAKQAWNDLNDPTARLTMWIHEGTPHIVAQGKNGTVTLLASKEWETVAELLIRAATDLRQAS